MYEENSEVKMSWTQSCLPLPRSAISEHSLILAIDIIFIYSNKRLWAVLLTALCHFLKILTAHIIAKILQSW